MVCFCWQIYARTKLIELKVYLLYFLINHHNFKVILRLANKKIANKNFGSRSLMFLSKSVHRVFFSARMFTSLIQNKQAYTRKVNTSHITNIITISIQSTLNNTVYDTRDCQKRPNFFPLTTSQGRTRNFYSGSLRESTVYP